eukprot:TRINITY_DN2573_c0_g1_i1.p1 TRINITY_DN2573_c0_g1~~TRINITY_DN2573_c0_g1_i1.p1  ORF type:complete len:308 (+),score=42.33 TRINITY_DN2573_c0_g1_i1:85-1008(+)
MEIPKDIIEYLASEHLEYIQVLNLASTAKKNKYLAKDDRIWKRLVERKFHRNSDVMQSHPGLSFKLSGNNTPGSYKKMFFHLHKYENIFRPVDHAALQKEMSAPMDYLVKLIMIGDSGVGKTSLLTKFVRNEFIETPISTIGVDFLMCRMESTTEYGGQPIQAKVQIWDTAPRERIMYYSKSAFRGAHGVVIVFDVTDKNSLERVRFYKNEMVRNITDQSLLDAAVLVGNKIDLESKRVVSTEDARKLAEELKLTYIETSAKTGSGVDAVFCTTVSIAVQGGIPKYSPPAPVQAPINLEKTSRCVIS